MPLPPATARPLEVLAPDCTIRGRAKSDRALDAGVAGERDDAETSLAFTV
ncbi:MAG: hypothetical protein NVSMB4_10240 [Acidimicrobiales bacterium]